jgi:hypothetical protein
MTPRALPLIARPHEVRASKHERTERQAEWPEVKA